MGKFQAGVARPENAGRKKNSKNKTTVTFKEAVNKLLEHGAPSMIKWLDTIAMSDPAKAMDCVAKLAEFAYPKLARTTIDGDPNNPIQQKHDITVTFR